MKMQGMSQYIDDGYVSISSTGIMLSSDGVCYEFKNMKDLIESINPQKAIYKKTREDKCSKSSLDRFCEEEAKFRLQKYHNIPDIDVDKYTEDVSKIMKEVINDNTSLYDIIDNKIEEYFKEEYAR